MTTVAPTAGPIPSGFNCEGVLSMPIGGYEVLILAAFFFFVTVSYCVTFLDVAAKQMWPSKFLDPAVTSRVKQIQEQFPLLKEGPASPDDAPVKVGSDAPSTYTHVVAQESYIAGRTVDEDLITMLANNNAYGTVSSYCASTVRGYAMLSMVLTTASMSLGFLWMHNVMIDPATAKWPGLVTLLGYLLVMLTGTVMTNPNSNVVYRDANICLWTNVPMKLFGKSNWTLKLHDIGIVAFVALPLISHVYTLITQGHSLPNYTGALTGVAWQVIGAILFGLAGLLNGRGLTKVQSNKCSIIAEIIAVFASFLAYIQWEFYATAVCAGNVTGFHSLMLGAAFTPFAFIAKRYWCAPSSFPTDASLILMDGDTPVGTSGPAPAEVFYADESILSTL